MNIITLASRKGGAGKSTLTAHLAAFSRQAGHRCVVIDADPQGSLTLWHSLRADGKPAVAQRRPRASTARSPPPWSRVTNGLSSIRRRACGWWRWKRSARRPSCLFPARPGFFDLNAVRETVATARERNKPYAVVLNAAPVKREDKEAPAVTQSRAFFDNLGIPVWSGQISQRTGYVLTLAAGASVCEVTPELIATSEIAQTVVGSRTLGRCDQPSAPRRGRCRRTASAA